MTGAADDHLDALGHRHSAPSLDGAYSAAAALAGSGLRAAWPPLSTRSGAFTVPFACGALSATGWLDGRTPTAEEAGEPGHVREVLAALDALHACPPPPRTPGWEPRVDPAFPQRLRGRTAAPWTRGPLGEQAREAVTAGAGEHARHVIKRARYTGCVRAECERGHHAAAVVPATGLLS